MTDHMTCPRKYREVGVESKPGARTLDGEGMVCFLLGEVITQGDSYKCYTDVYHHPIWVAVST